MQPRVRVHHITRDYPPQSKGGLSTAVGGLVAALADAGVPSTVQSFDAYRPTRTGPPVALEVPSAAPTLIHCHDALLWPFAADLRDRLRVPAVYTAHVLQAHQRQLRGLPEPTLSEQAEVRALAEADLVLAPSVRAAALLPVPAHRLRVTPLGIADTAAARAAASARVHRLEPGFILFAGRFSDMNGGSELRTTVHTLLERHPGRRAVMAGGLPDNPRGERRWRRQLEAINPRVEVTGWLAPDALAARYADAALLLAPSRFETFGLVALEAMLHGLPIAATTAHPLLEHERTALLSAPGDAEALTDAADRLLRDPVLSLRLATTAAATARARHLWPQVLPAHLAAYAMVTATGPRGGGP